MTIQDLIIVSADVDYCSGVLYKRHIIEHLQLSCLYVCEQEYSVNIEDMHLRSHNDSSDKMALNYKGKTNR